MRPAGLATVRALCDPARSGRRRLPRETLARLNRPTDTVRPDPSRGPSAPPRPRGDALDAYPAEVTTVTRRSRWVQTVTPMEQHPEYGEERLDTLQSIRAAFLDLAEAGDEAAAGIVRAVDAMIAEVEEWIRLS
jgi:hypothetical protein